MRRTVIGFVVGFLLAAALAWGGTGKWPAGAAPLDVWTGEGARPGLYSSHVPGKDKPGEYHFYECKEIGGRKITPPPAKP